MMAEQLPLAVAQRTPPTLDNFVVGHNAEILERLRRDNGRLYLRGNPGSGKTHLLRARARSQAGALYLSAAHLSAPEPPSLAGSAEAPWLGLDDIETLAATTDAAVALLRVIDARDAAGRPTVVASRQQVRDQSELLRDLQTRLSQWPSFHLRALDEATLMEWLSERARERGLTLTNGTDSWMMRRLPRDPAHLEQALQRLDIAALAAKRSRLTIPFARSVLGSGD